MSKDKHSEIPHHIIIDLDVEKGVIIKDIYCVFETRIERVIGYINNIFVIVKNAPLIPEDEEDYYQGVLKEILELCGIDASKELISRCKPLKGVSE